MAFCNFIWPERDRVSIEIPLSLPEELKCVFAIVRKREAKKLLENYADIKDMTKMRESEILSDEFSIFAEYDEISRYILTQNVLI